MYSLFLYTCLFSAVSLLLIWIIDRRHAVASHHITRMALLALLLLPAMLLLPEWHILPSSATVHPIIETARQSSPPWIAALWAIGLVICSARIAASMWQLQQWKKNSSPLTESTLLETLQHCRDKIHYHGIVSLREMPNCSGPAAAGLLQPTIFMPPQWRDWPQDTLQAVLLHELSHHVNRDPLWRLLSLVCRSLHWFNPCVSWLSRKWVDQSEFNCDARVIGSGFRKDTYAHILCDLASNAPYSAMAMAAPSSLERRIRQLGEASRQISHWWLYTFIIALMMGALAIAILRPAKDPGAPIPPTLEDTQLRMDANPFPADSP